MFYNYKLPLSALIAFETAVPAVQFYQPTHEEKMYAHRVYAHHRSHQLVDIITVHEKLCKILRELEIVLDEYC